MFYTATDSHSKNKQTPKKKHVNIKDQYTEELIVRIPVHQCMSISTIKQKIQQKIGGVNGGIGKIRLRYKQQLLQNNNASIADYNIKNESTLYYSPVQSIDNFGMIHPYFFDNRMNKSINSTLAEIKKALNCKIIPKLTESGISGSYFLENVDRNNVAIFKPLDEEPYAPNNPKGYVGKLGQRGIRSGIRSGEQGYREVVAYILDPEGFHGVPATTFVEFYHPSFKYNQSQLTNQQKEDHNIKRPSFIDVDKANFQQILSDFNQDQIKRGSLQVFVKNTEECGNYGNSIFSIDEVHKIAILDIRILNCDRNDQNILVKKKKKKKVNINPQELKKLPNYKAQLLEYDFQLIPIDHGLSLSDSFDICQDDLNWMWWEQSEQQFSEKSLQYIEQIQIEQDLKILQNQFNLREECLKCFRIANIVLKKGAQSGLTIKEIGNILYREDSEIESTVEKLIQDAQHYANICINGGNSDLIKKKIQKDMAKNNLKRQADMTSIKEQYNMEESVETSKFKIKLESTPIKNGEDSPQRSPVKNGNGKECFDDIFINQPTILQKVESCVSNIDNVDDSYYLSPINSLKAEKNMSQNKVHIVKLKRSFSLPDLQSAKIKNQNGEQLDQSEPDNSGKSDKKQVNVKFSDQNEHGSALKIGIQSENLSKVGFLGKKADAAKLKKQNEDIFFYYFENVLNMHIEKIIQEKLNPNKGRKRGRLSSEEYTKQTLLQYKK
ncbi:phosphatidylinositol 3- and 4-kinase family protein (macronuclear) [Tetrahymena thermophila SB210]|uniref:Phosphatidylinositol 3-and 4-kinase family protein n=1 Tax=Tetrahymena thermophila (strain SB210) TaxID=312017 RepID=I7MM74_TETTS|nr:phosphatidylinositol 3- and 4-kinase family protein [Tetrahymena thermophila SB210]EAS04300.2 phosphatidylinositol 3- and 4-kinase family protein [Tetrahymena thermophila SB210]|eukprot:XP_001024545.2 phosphatidylinositol 3- and 4-kinase family protein [Tetrahymena thermophila SB210]